MNTFEQKTLRFRFLYNQFQSKEFRQWIPLILIVILGTILRLYQIGTESIWIDEQFSIRDAEQLKLKLRLFYYLFLKVWMIFGDSDGWLRLSSVPFSLGAIVLLYLLALKVANRWTAIIAAFMMAVSPFFIGYAQEIRMYSMGTFFSLLGTIGLMNVLEKVTLKKSIFIWIIGRFLSILTTPINIFLILPDLILIQGNFKNQKKILNTISKGLIIIGLIWFPFIYALIKEIPDFFNWVADTPKPNLLLIPAKLINFTVFWPVKAVRFSYESAQKSSEFGWEKGIYYFYIFFNLILIVLLALGFLQVIKQVQQKVVKPKLIWIAAWAIFPFLILLSVSYLTGSLLIDRYLIFIAPYYIILLTIGFQTIVQNYRLIGLGIAAIYLIAVTGGLNFYYTHVYHDDWKAVIALIEAEKKSGDAIGFYAKHWQPHLALPRYYKGSLPMQALANPDLNYPNKLNKKLVLEILDLLPQNHSRYWLVLYPQADVQTIQSVLEERYDILRHEIYPNLTNASPEVFLIQPKTVISNQ